MLRMIILCLLAALFATAQTGCVSLYRNKPIDVLVLDAETNQPIQGAKIQPSYSPNVGVMSPEVFAFNATINKPSNGMVTTDANGKTTLRVADFHNASLDCKSDGYLSEVGSVFGNCPLITGSSDAKLIDGQIVIQMYQGPEPIVSVVVPNGYRGRILIERTNANESDPQQFGQRNFQFPINERGYVAIIETPLLRKADQLDLRFIYADGSEIPEDRENTKDSEVVLRYVTTGCYVLDTKAEHDLLHRAVYDYIDGKSNHVSSNHEAIEQLRAIAASP